MAKEIDRSIVATGGSTITNAAVNAINELKKAKRISWIVGFITGVASSLAANFIWSNYLR